MEAVVEAAAGAEVVLAEGEAPCHGSSARSSARPQTRVARPAVRVGAVVTGVEAVAASADLAAAVMPAAAEQEEAGRTDESSTDSIY